ncbi:hemolysin family protein [Spirochaeta isovalerica]|uniref:CBS domain containing-hemolysin-like protein n=1 Tax=Spirochaeta isovalerica TaxID=150 RepID=A0A841R6A5_9SPIO|nr:hemolysin family protein [Spirochaeta isovalerica]MBB6478539.1 CBS domain containing-hemolysin-like protein [Spirochaeta isovalerica]
MKFFNKRFKNRKETILAEEELGDLNLDEKDMIRGIVELSDTSIKEVIVPRIDVVFISDEIGEDELYKTLVESGHSRFPVYRETIDNVIGILYVKDLFSKIVNKESLNIPELIRKPYFVPETMKLDALLKEFKHRRVHIAIAVDEYGGVSGIVCMEDIIEEIVGDIQDEFDNEDEDILAVGEGIYLCYARVSIEDFNEELSMNISDDDYDTLGGFVFDLFGKIPVRFEKVSYEGVDFIIQSMDGHKINTIKVVKKDI